MGAYMKVVKVITDTETGGTTPATDGLGSIGALIYTDPKRTFYVECRVDKDKKINEGALKVNGFTEAQMRDPNKPSVQEGVRAFVEWIEEYSKGQKDKMRVEIGGENPVFDISFIQPVVREIGRDWTFGYRALDLHSIVSGQLETLNPEYRDAGAIGIVVNTDIAIEYTGLYQRKGPHNALEDAKLEAEALSRALRGKSLIEEYAKIPVPIYLDVNADMRQREESAFYFCKQIEEREAAAANK